MSGRGHSYDTRVFWGELNIPITFIHSPGFLGYKSPDAERGGEHTQGNGVEEGE